MRVEYLNEFIVLCDTMNFTKAAKQLFISQPVLSTHIQNLEKEVGVSLLERSEHRIRLTKQGKAFLADARIVMGSYERMMDNVRDSSSGSIENIRIGFLRNSYSKAMMGLAQKTKQLIPKTRLLLKSGGYVDIHEALINREIDIALSIDCDATLEDLYNVEHLANEHIYLAAPRSLISAEIQSRGYFTPPDINQFPILEPSRSETGKYALWLDEKLRELGITPSIQGQFLDAEMRHFEMLDKQCGCFLMEDFTDELDSDLFAFYPIKSGRENDFEISLVAVWKKTNRSKAIANIVKITSAEISKQRKR